MQFPSWENFSLFLCITLSHSLSFSFSHFLPHSLHLSTCPFHLSLSNLSFLYLLLMCLSILHLSLSLSCNHLFITVLSCLSCCTCCLCISICQHLSLSLCFCVVSITVTIIYLSNIYLYLICLLQSFSLPHSLSLRLSQPQYIYLTYPCDILFHGLFLSIYLFSGSLHFFSLCFSVSYSIIVFLADSIISFVFFLPF